MAKSNKVKTKAVLTRAVLTAGAAVLLISLFLYLAKRKGERIIDECGIPDAVSSISDGEKCCLTVVANSGQIPDEEAFAREVIRMCMENSFRSLRFSTDIGGWPEELEIDVYLQKEGCGRGAAGLQDPGRIGAGIESLCMIREISWSGIRYL